MSKRKVKTRRHTMVLTMGDKEVRFPVPYTDATQDVTFSRVVQDVRNGVPGSVGECMNHKCIERQVSRFPHPAHWGEVTSSRVFIADKVNKQGHPTHAIRYVWGQNDSRDIRLFDTKKKKSLIKGAYGVEVERDVTLLAPRSYHKTNPWGGKTHVDDRTGEKADRKASSTGPRGSFLRRLRSAHRHTIHPSAV